MTSPTRAAARPDETADTRYDGDVETRAATLMQRFAEVRAQTARLCEPLEIEDYGVQPMADASPPKWHLAHTTWFFETFLLKAALPDYKPYDERFEYLFNSYYNGVGTPFPRTRRGALSRPTVADVYRYRASVEGHLREMVAQRDSGALPFEELLQRLELGLHHEQQHQELLLTDLKYNFAHNPMFPVYGGGPNTTGAPVPLGYTEFEAGLVEIGAAQGAGFGFDNEFPRHKVHLEPFGLASRLVTNGEYLAFVQDGGYRTPQLWLSDGWSTVTAQDWSHPLYWHRLDGEWYEYRLDGLVPLDAQLPVVHLSAYEAAAFASWCDARLPTEFEWEHAAAADLDADRTPGFVENGALHPQPAAAVAGLQQMQGAVWQWTSSGYGPYPGYAPLPGALGEYNGKFMSNQLVLRGASCATPRSHARATYRNFFYAADRWQFAGMRLAQTL